MLSFSFLDPRVTPDHIGLIPAFFVELDPRDAIDQINERYAHGGGWFDLKVGERGFRQFDDFAKLHYPGDPPLHAYAEATLHLGTDKPERIVIYESGFVAIIQADQSFRVSRLD